jgi:UDP-3-O-acyl-N-acetylglucosamine deacetylase
VGHLVAHRAGHALHTAFAAKVLEETHAWRLVQSPDEATAPLPLTAPVKGVAARLAD